ncbi:MAG: glycosyltransferase family 2 protein [Bacillota bacterium]
MKLIIQIPCLNEEETLPYTLADLPRSIPGVDEIEILVIDDGSTDRTVPVAMEYGVQHIVRHAARRGLAAAFRTGLDAALAEGADIIVNTDGDNQYSGHDIPRLIQPILDGTADVVIGDRRVTTIDHFSPTKKFLQVLGSSVVRLLSHTDVADTTSGFRAFSREAALRLNIVSEFTYTLETIIQCGHRKLAVTHVPIRTNRKLRESRLFKGIWNYVSKSVVTLIRVYTNYRPLKVFTLIGLTLVLGAVALGVRYLLLLAGGSGQGHVQSLLLATAMGVVGVQTIIFGLLADLMAAHRRLMEETLYRVRKLEYGGPRSRPAHWKESSTRSD